MTNTTNTIPAGLIARILCSLVASMAGREVELGG
jgi:hypothetical protein